MHLSTQVFGVAATSATRFSQHYIIKAMVYQEVLWKGETNNTSLD